MPGMSQATIGQPVSEEDDKGDTIAKQLDRWVSFASPSVDIRNTPFQEARLFASCGKVSSVFQMLYAGSCPASHLDKYTKFYSPIDAIFAKPARSMTFGSLNVLPVELFDEIMSYLSDDDRTLLAITNSSFFRVFGQNWKTVKGQAWNQRVNLITMLEVALSNQKGKKLRACWLCAALHSQVNFSSTNWRKEASRRFCLLRLGQIKLGPHLHLTWPDMRDLQNNSRSTRYAVIWHDAQPDWYQCSMADHNVRPKALPRGNIHVIIELRRFDHKVCVYSRFEFPHLVKGARRHLHWHYLQSLPVSIRYLCPHHDFADGKWHDVRCKRCPNEKTGNNSGNGREEVMRCAECWTDIWYGEEKLADGSACFVIKTWKFLGSARYYKSKEWEAQRIDHRYRAAEQHEISGKGFLHQSDRGCPLSCGGKVKKIVEMVG